MNLNLRFLLLVFPVIYSSSFHWESGGKYMAFGIGDFYTTLPSFSHLLTCNVTLHVDPHQQNIWLLGGEICGNQYITPNGFYLINTPLFGPNVCAHRPSGNFSAYVQTYKQALKQPWNEILFDVYGGLVNDPGSCDGLSATVIRTKKRNHRIKEYTLHWKDTHFFMQAQIRFTRWRRDVDSIEHQHQLPFICKNHSLVINYCSR